MLASSPERAFNWKHVTVSGSNASIGSDAQFKNGF